MWRQRTFTFLYAIKQGLYALSDWLIAASTVIGSILLLPIIVPVTLIKIFVDMLLRDIDLTQEDRKQLQKLATRRRK